MSTLLSKKIGRAWGKPRRIPLGCGQGKPERGKIVSVLTNGRAIDKNYGTTPREVSVKNYKKRVVITGVGPVTPVGIGKENYWESLIKGKSSFRRISFPERDMSPYRSQIGAPIEGFELSKYINPTKHSKRL